jgi:hypothetical protein
MHLPNQLDLNLSDSQQIGQNIIGFNTKETLSILVFDNLYILI